MRSHLRDAALIGAVGGLLFYLNALFPRTYLYPLVWPLIAGAVAVYSATHTAPRSHEWLSAVTWAFSSGIVSGMFFFLTGIGTLYAIGRVTVDSFPALSNQGLTSLDRIQVVNSAIIAFVAIPASAIAGGVFMRLILAQHRRSAGNGYHAQPA